MRIEINIINDDGTTITIGHNQKILVEGTDAKPWIWASKFNSDDIRGLTYEQAWAASFLCMTAACEHLPVPTSHTSSLAAAHAWHQEQQRDDQIKAIEQMRERSRRGKFMTTPEGDTQHDPAT